MPRYRFTTSALDGEADIQAIEIDLVDDRMARDEALRALGDLVRDNLLRGDRVFQCDVREGMRTIFDGQIEFSEKAPVEL